MGAEAPSLFAVGGAAPHTLVGRAWMLLLVQQSPCAAVEQLSNCYARGVARSSCCSAPGPPEARSHASHSPFLPSPSPRPRAASSWPRPAQPWRPLRGQRELGKSGFGMGGLEVGGGARGRWSEGVCSTGREGWREQTSFALACCRSQYSITLTSTRTTTSSKRWGQHSHLLQAAPTCVLQQRQHPLGCVVRGQAGAGLLHHTTKQGWSQEIRSIPAPRRGSRLTHKGRCTTPSWALVAPQSSGSTPAAALQQHCPHGERLHNRLSVPSEDGPGLLSSSI